MNGSDVLRRLHRQHRWAGWIGIKHDTAVRAIGVSELADASRLRARNVPALEHVRSRLGRHPDGDQPAVGPAGEKLEEDDARAGFGGGVEGRLSARHGRGRGPGATEGEGAAGEGLEAVGGEVGEGGCAEVGVGDVLVEDVCAEEEGPERAHVRHCTQAFACLDGG